jgi:hypothetical protein
MFPVYTAEALSSLSLAAIKEIARKIGAVPTADLRKRASWMQAILDSQVDKIQSVADELVAELTADIDAVADAAQAAVYQGDSEAHREIEEKLAATQELLAVAQNTLSNQMAEVRGLIARIDAVIAPPQVEFWWFDNYQGTVTVDGKKRQFKIVSLYGGSPVVQILSSKGQWVDSRWYSARNNRYINAVLAEIPGHIQAMHDRILASDSMQSDAGDEEIWDGDIFLGNEDEDDEEIYRGKGRGRIETVKNEWGWVEF